MGCRKSNSHLCRPPMLEFLVQKKHGQMVSALRMIPMQARQNRVTVCISDVDKWMASNRVPKCRQNSTLVCSASNRQQHVVPVIHFLSAEISNLQSPFTIFGIFLDSELVVLRSRLKTVGDRVFGVARK